MKGEKMSLSYNERVLLPYFKVLKNNMIKNRNPLTADKLISRSINVCIDFLNPNHTTYDFNGILQKPILAKRGRIDVNFEELAKEISHEIIVDINNFGLVRGTDGSCPDSVQFFIEELPNGTKVMSCIVHQYFNTLSIITKDILHYSKLYKCVAYEVNKLFPLVQDFAGLNFHIGSFEAYKRDEQILEDLSKLKG